MKFLELFKRKKEPLNPYITVEVRRKGKTIESYRSDGSAEEQIYSYSRIFAIIEYYKVEIIHNFAESKIILIISEKKDDEIFPTLKVEENKKRKKEDN